MKRVAAIDCGTNTIKLLIADLDAGSGTAREHVREMRMVRLGQDVDRTGRFADEALERVFGALDEYAALISAHAVDALRFCATSAARDADNAAVFVAGVRARLGQPPEVVSGNEEAQLSYDGATRELAERDLPPPFLVIDIGGGSTELILGDPATGSAQRGRGHVRMAESLDIGSVRLTERHLRSDPPSAAEVAATVADIDTAVASTVVPLGDARTVVGVAGTITTVAAGVLDLAAYDRAAIDHAVLGYGEVHAMTESLLGMTRAGRTALPYMHPGRADVIGAGALILDRVLRGTSVDSLLVSEADILDGIAWSLA
ncbi:MAG TPA: Ppx/GppA phosphatase family protein [Nocardioidaceae bacterium]|nr:Ppx/GppA phosphatase family protein [Nocardioidaceae bacterium]